MELTYPSLEAILRNETMLHSVPYAHKHHVMECLANKNTKDFDPSNIDYHLVNRY
jgi:hypothetical protein